MTAWHDSLFDCDIIRCDHVDHRFTCTRQLFPEDGDADEMLRAEGWQTVRHSDGTTSHHCPDHWHVWCDHCRTNETGTRDRLTDKGFDVDILRDGNGRVGECARCA